MGEMCSDGFTGLVAKRVRDALGALADHQERPLP